VDISFYQMRIASIEEAAKRSRWVFAASIIASIAILGTVWNSSPFGLYEFASTVWKPDGGGLSTDEATSELQKALLKGWTESLFVNIPLFGIRFSVNDIWFLGTMALFIIAIWEFYGLRRENHLIGKLLRDAAPEDERTRAFVFYGVCETQVFATLTDNDSPVTSLNANVAQQIIPGLRPVVWLLTFLPAGVIFCVVLTDLATVFWWGAPFRTGHQTMLAAARSKGTEAVIGLLIEVFIEDGAALCFAIITGFLLWRATQFQTGTIQLLREVAGSGWGTVHPGP
jgi:hypothetical protein